MNYNEIIILDKDANTSTVKVMGVGNLSSIAVFDDVDEVHLSEEQAKHLVNILIDHFDIRL